MTNPTARLPEDRIPVIVGVGEIVDRPKEIAAGLEPLTLLEQALRRAEEDSGGKLLGFGLLPIVGNQIRALSFRLFKFPAYLSDTPNCSKPDQTRPGL